MAASLSIGSLLVSCTVKEPPNRFEVQGVLTRVTTSGLQDQSAVAKILAGEDTYIHGEEWQRRSGFRSRKWLFSGYSGTGIY